MSSSRYFKPPALPEVSDCRVRTQIQLPDPLYRQVKEIAALEDWSVAEVIRRGTERMVKAYPAVKHGQGPWQFPPPIRGRKLLVSDSAKLKQIAKDEMLKSIHL